MEESKTECCICMESEKDLILLRCHQKHVVCFDCSKEIKKCPMCRVETNPKLYENKTEKVYEFIDRVIEVPRIEYVNVYQPPVEIKQPTVLKPIKKLSMHEEYEQNKYKNKFLLEKRREVRETATQFKNRMNRRKMFRDSFQENPNKVICKF